MKIGFLLIDGFALMSCASAVEPLRAANLLAGDTLFQPVYLSREGGRVRASCGAWFKTRPLKRTARFDMLFVVAGGDPMGFSDPALFAGLRELSAKGMRLGGISGGGVILARAGVMENRRFTVHWEHFEALREWSETLLLERRLFVIDRDRATCAGGSAPLDMMHAMIRAEHGAELASAVSDWFIHTGIRAAEAPQRARNPQGRTLHHTTATALDLMESQLADPFPVARIARLVGASERQLQRHFSEDLGQSVAQTWLEMRLAKADELLRQTRLPVTEVALTCGFSSPSHFATRFRARFGQSPRKRRQAAPSSRT
ncbi:GlxA family transcriptional regulator [Tropicimonas sp. TH_r6]|uniref:GlxA family transcriptional regulator n=1 Tax=Tropicimonas sp. TH_r6 TaxID=3082085 RepID=UPI002954F842|nr:GlxA family transcriptional regulator [Tropicimonas sp. TH_r6]MDV7144872.1 GlxA family transcriptional regulator [Tropicimonas sp. TH_r6]